MARGALALQAIRTISLSKPGWKEALLELHQLCLLQVANQAECNAVLRACSHTWVLASLLLQTSLAQSLEADVITYTSAVKACERSVGWQHATHLLEGAQQREVKVDVILRSAVASCLDMTPHWRFAQLILQKVPGLVDAFVLSMSMNICRNGGSWQVATELLSNFHLHEAESINTVACNTVLGACEDASGWHQGLGLVMNLKHNRLDAAIAVYNTLIGSLARRGLWAKAQQVLQDVAAIQVEATNVTHHAVVAAFDKQDLWRQARWLLSPSPDINSLSPTGSGPWPLALAWLAELHWFRVRSDVVDVSRTISNGFSWRWALQLLTSRGRCNFSPCDVAAVGAAAAACGRALEVTKAMSLLQAIDSPDVVLFNIVMSAAGAVNLWQGVQMMLKWMQHLRLRSQIVTYNTAISSCDTGKEWQQSRLLLKELKRETMKPTTVTFNSAIATARQGGWKTSIACLEEMRHHGIQANSITYNTAIDAYAPFSLWHRALELRQSDELDVISCTSLVTSCSALSGWQKGWFLLEDLWEHGLPVNEVLTGSTSSLTMADLFLAPAIWRKTSLMLDIFRRRRADPNVLALSCVLTACERGCGHAHFLQALRIVDHKARNGLSCTFCCSEMCEAAGAADEAATH